MDTWMQTLAWFFGISAVAGLSAKLLKLPVILGYMAAGIILALWGNGNSGSVLVLTETMGRLGVTFLLFIAGLDLPLSELKKIGGRVIAAGAGQISVSLGLALGVFLAMKFSFNSALVLAMSVSLASTVVIVKTLSEKNDLQSLYGKITVGYLLIQDLAAVIFLSIISSGGGNMWIVPKVLLVFAAAYFLSRRASKAAADYLAKWPELLLVCSVGWCLVVAALLALPIIGLGFEIGGFAAGLTLASVTEQAQIAAKMKTLRDFFLTWFFLSLGVKVGVSLNILDVRLLLVSLMFPLIINPITMGVFLSLLGYGKRVVYSASLGMMAISEFSLIIVSEAVRTGLLPAKAGAALASVMIITVVAYGYVSAYPDKLFLKIKPFLKKGHHKISGLDKIAGKLDDHIVLFGHNRVGSKVRSLLSGQNRDVLVVDFNPSVIEFLTRTGVSAVYGDMADDEMYQGLGLAFASMIISTVPDEKDSRLLLEEAVKWPKKPFLIMTAVDNVSALKLYSLGADFVLVPHAVGADYLGKLILQGPEALKSEAVKQRKGLEV